VRSPATGRGSRDGESPALLISAGLVLALSAAALVCLAVNGLHWFSLALGVLLAGLAAWVAVPVRRSRRRARQVRHWAAEHGWLAEPPRSRMIIGGSEVLHRVVDGVPVTSCTTVYEPDWRRGVDTTRFRHLLMSALPVDFPVLTLVPTGGARRAPAGPDDGPALQVEWSAFNDAWLVQCADARFAHAFCHPRLMERLMRPDVAGLSVLVAGGDVTVHALGRTDLAALEARAAVVGDLVRLVPTAVLRGAIAGESTGWPTIAMTTIVLVGVGWFVAMMVRSGEVAFALGTVGVVAAVGAIPLLKSLAVRRRRKALR
jgi:hypothetical protein